MANCSSRATRAFPATASFPNRDQTFRADPLLSRFMSLFQSPKPTFSTHIAAAICLGLGMAWVFHPLWGANDTTGRLALLLGGWKTQAIPRPGKSQRRY